MPAWATAEAATIARLRGWTPIIALQLEYSLLERETNIGSLDVTVTDAQRAALDEVSTPKLNFPAENNRLLAPSLQFAGATVDGRPSTASALLHANSARY